MQLHKFHSKLFLLSGINNSPFPNTLEKAIANAGISMKKEFLILLFSHSLQLFFALIIASLYSLEIFFHFSNQGIFFMIFVIQPIIINLMCL